MRHFWLASHASNLYDISPRFCLGKTKRYYSKNILNKLIENFFPDFKMYDAR